MVLRRPSCKNLIITRKSGRDSPPVPVIEDRPHEDCRLWSPVIKLKWGKLVNPFSIQVLSIKKSRRIKSVHDQMLAWHLTPSEWPLLSEQLCLLHHFIAVTKPAWDERTVGRWRTSYYWSHFSVQGPGNFLRERLSVTGLDGVNVLTGQRSGHHEDPSRKHKNLTFPDCRRYQVLNVRTGNINITPK